MRVVFVFPPHNTFSTLRTSPLSRLFRPHPSIHLYPSTNSGLAHWSILNDGLPTLRLRQHYSITPAQHTPLPLNRVPETYPQVPPSIQDTVSYWTRPGFASSPLSLLNGADSPFLHMILKAVLMIWSQFSEYKFIVILAPQWTSSSFFPGANASEEIESSTPQGRWGKFTGTLGFRRGNIEEKSGERLWYRECPALNPCNSTVTLISPR